MWQQDSTYYPGKCVGYDAASGKHTIEYEDGSTEVLRLRREDDRANSASAIWRLCGKRRRSNDSGGREVESKDESHNDYDTRGGHNFTSKYRGVSWVKSSSKWRAEIQHTGKKRSLGYFDDEQDAARAYDRAARTHHGDKATLNFAAEGEQGMSVGVTSEYRGVSWGKRDSKWRAEICHTGKKHSLGTFDDDEEAARAYDKAARALHGGKAMLNFPAEGEQDMSVGVTSEYRGVSWNKSSNKWIAKIRHTGMHPSVITALGFRLQASTPRGAGAEVVGDGGEGMGGNPIRGKISEYRGVSWSKSSSKWRAQIQHTGRSHSLGCFDDEEEAARAYDKAAREHHGGKAMLKFAAEGEQGEGIGRTSRKKRSGKCQASIRHAGKRRNLGKDSFDDDEETARAYDRATKAHHLLQRSQELAAAAPDEVHSWSGMYPSVVVALGFRLQVDMPRGTGVGAEAKDMSAAGEVSRGGEKAKLGLGVMVVEAGDETTWACESILRKRHTTGKVEYEVGEHYRQHEHPIYILYIVLYRL
jgi:hypothetical protein